MAQLAQHRQKAQRIALVVVFPPDHVDADIQVAILVDLRVELPQPVLRVGSEAQQRILEAHRHTGGHRILGGEALAEDLRHFIGRQRLAVGPHIAINGDLALQVHQALLAEGLHVLVQDVGDHIRVVEHFGDARPVGVEKLVTAFEWLVQPHAVQPGGLLAGIQILQALVFGLLAVAELPIARGVNVLEQQ